MTTQLWLLDEPREASFPTKLAWWSAMTDQEPREGLVIDAEALRGDGPEHCLGLIETEAEWPEGWDEPDLAPQVEDPDLWQTIVEGLPQIHSEVELERIGVLVDEVAPGMASLVVARAKGLDEEHTWIAQQLKRKPIHTVKLLEAWGTVEEYRAELRGGNKW